MATNSVPLGGQIFLGIVMDDNLFLIIMASIIENFEIPWLMPIIAGITAIYLGVVFYYKFKTLKLS